MDGKCHKQVIAGNKCSCTDCAGSKTECLGPHSINEVRYAFSLAFFGHGFEKVTVKACLRRKVRIYYKFSFLLL